MRILYLSPEVPNRFHRIRSWHLIQAMTERHEVDLLSLAHFEPDASDVDALRARCRRVDWLPQPRLRSLWSCLRGLPGVAPLEACYEASLPFAVAVAQRLAERSYDLLYVKRLRMAQYGVGVSLPRVLDLTDSMARFYRLTARRAPLAQKPLAVEEWLKHRAYEPRMAAAFDRAVLASPVDAAYLRRLARLDNLRIVANGVDANHFAPWPTLPEPGRFLLSGLMDKLVNVDAARFLAREIWPLVRAALPDARLRLVGPRPNATVRALAALPGTEVVGRVVDLRAEMARAEVVLVPLRVGTGTKNKILQALSMGRPVVTTFVGNEGLGAEAGRHLEVADGPRAFAEAVLGLHGEPARATAMGAEGRAWLVERFGLEAVAAQLEAVVEEVTREHAEAGR